MSDLRDQITATLADYCPAHGLFAATCERCTARTTAVMAVIEPAMLQAEVAACEDGDRTAEQMRASLQAEIDRQRERAEQAEAALATARFLITAWRSTGQHHPADDLAAVIGEATDQRDEQRQRAEKAERQTQAVIDEVLTVCDSFDSIPDDIRKQLYSFGRADGLAWARAAVERAMGKGERNSIPYVPRERAEKVEAAVQKARTLATEAIAGWEPERDYHRDRAERKGYSLNEASAEIYGDAIEVLTEIRAALDQSKETP